MYYKRIFLSFKLCIHLMKLYIFEAFLLLGSGYKRHIFMQSWARVPKITSRLAPVRLFQTVSRLALSRIFKQKNRVI